MKSTLYVMIFLFTALSSQSQGMLDKPLSVEFHQQPLGKVLEILSHAGNFYFSYSSGLVKKDSLITLNTQGRTVRQILDLLFHGSLEYKENGNYIILRRASADHGMIMIRAAPDDKRYIVSGVILDENTGETISQASVYDKHGLIATLTNEDGFFTVRLKRRSGPAALTVSKEFYEDTTVKIEPGADQKITIVISPLSVSRKMVTISPDGYLPSDSIRVELNGNPVYMRKDPIRVEMTGWGKLLLSSRLKIQSINLGKYFIQQPFQLSFLPGIGTQGPLSPQITNKFSVNILGGYTAGLEGVEMGGVFNIDKRNIRGVQAAGVINVVGGSVEGVQLAGLHNSALDSLKGVQAAGISNINKRKLKGVQLAGIYNCVSDTMEGLQAAGVVNNARQVNGVQISGLVNITRHLKGLQLGIINIADTSDGCSIGLINISHNGFRELSIFANEISPVNLAFRSGNNSLYSIILAGFNPGEDHRSYHYGLGLGHRFLLNKKLSLDPELTTEHLAAGTWENFSAPNFLYKLSLDLHFRPGRHFAISGGPSLAFYSFDHITTLRGHVFSPVYEGYPTWSVSDKWTAWVGWRFSINFL